MDDIEVICEAWRQKKPELLKQIIAPEFAWYETPFGDPIKDEATLLKQWEGDLEHQQDINVSFDVLSVIDDQTIARWHATFLRSGTPSELDGIFAVRVNEAGQLTEFRQWWVSKDAS
jgi:hypothetical protein